MAAVERFKQESMYYGVSTKKVGRCREVAVSGWSFDCSIRSLQVDLSDYGVGGVFALIMYKETAFLFLLTFENFALFLHFSERCGLFVLAFLFVVLGEDFPLCQ